MTTALARIAHRGSIAPLLERPYFITERDEKFLIDLLHKGVMNEFYDEAAKRIKNSAHIMHLYVYLLNVLEKTSKDHVELRKQVCARLYDKSFFGWLEVPDVEVIDFCKENTPDPFLRDRIKNLDAPKLTLDEYGSYLAMERSIMYGLYSLTDFNKTVMEYYDFIVNLQKIEKISEDTYNETRARLEEEVTIKKAGASIGSLISPAVQEKIGCKKIYETLTVHKRDKLS